MESDPILRMVIAVVAGVVGIVVAAISGNVLVGVIALAAAAAIVFACLWSLRSTHPQHAMATVVIVPVVALLVGSLIAASVGEPSPTQAADRPRKAAPMTTVDRIPADPSGQLRAALDRADEMLPNGSATVLRVSLRDTSISLDVFDPSNGDQVSSSYSSSGWSAVRRSRATSRDFFARSQIIGLDLTKARPEAIRIADQLKVNRSFPHASDGIVVKRRYPDAKLVATFSMSGKQVEVDEKGRFADTVGAARLETVVPLARRVLAAAGLDLAAPIINQFDFRAFDDGSSSISASSVQNSGGFAVRFAAGKVDEIVVVPGAFPVIRQGKGRGSGSGFAMTDIRSAVLLKIRKDIMTRAKTPHYDTDLVGLEIGDVPFHRGAGAMIRMQVGPHSARHGGVYTLAGAWVRDGRY